MDKKNTIWITGASTGIGKNLAEKFAKNNYHVIGSARREINSEEFFSSKKASITYYKNDVSNLDEVSELSKKIQSDYNVECLINNAGITSFKPFVENSFDEIEKIFDTNLKGSIYTIKSVLPQMIEKKSGTIINILSVAAKKIFTNSSVYAASKAGLEIFSKVLREELREHNIRIINIYPGATSTEIWPDEAIEKFASKMMTPEKLADFIYEVYSSSSSISPEEIVVRPISGDL